MEKAKFYKVSYQQFEESYLDYDPKASQESIQQIYDELELQNVQHEDQQDMIFIHRLMFI